MAFPTLGPTFGTFASRGIGRLGEVLRERHLISAADLELAHERVRQTHQPLAETILEMGFVHGTELLPILSELTGYPKIELSETEFEHEATSLLSESSAQARRVVPFSIDDDDRVHVAMVDPMDVASVDSLRHLFGRHVVPYIALPDDINDAIRRVFDVRVKTQAVLDDMAPTVEEVASDSSADEAPIARLVNSFILGAVASGASDVHVEPHEDVVMVRYRIDGILYDHMTFPLAHLRATMSRLKIVSGLDIAERRRPQDGRFAVKDDGGNEYDVRLSLMPTVYGEKACMRLLLRQGAVASLELLGFWPEQLQLFRKFVDRPHGLVLVTGPTGSGKSTTLYAALQSINQRTRNINTVEDPVEYRLVGINQVQVNPKIGLTFATGLRTLVRQDPDVILVGEIRDRETAEISVQAALTGHLVLSTLHTNDAPGALVRLQNMGVEPFLISSAMVGVVGQRLLRSVCAGCREIVTISAEEAHALDLQGPGEGPVEVARGRGCKRCNGRGTKGRSAAYEVMSMSDELRTLVLSGASGADITRQALEEGMTPMRESAMRKVKEGIVPPEEVMRVFAHGD